DWDREAQTQWVRQAIATGLSFEEARAGQWTREFLKLGEALAAYDFAATDDVVPILICDEFDKISEKSRAPWSNSLQGALLTFRVTARSAYAINLAGPL